MFWIDLKAVLTGASGLERDALHILSGMGAHLLLVLVTRSWFGARWPIAIIALLALGNEWIDLSVEYWEGLRDRQYWEGAKDLATTLSVPVALLLLSRYAAARFDQPAALLKGPAPKRSAEGAVPPDAL